MYGKKKFPCGAYFGNLCGGFGGTLECHSCGWDKYEHGSLRTNMIEQYVALEYPKYNFEELKSNHPDVEFDITYNDYYDWWEVRFEGLMFEVLSPSDNMEALFRLCCQKMWEDRATGGETWKVNQ